MKNIQTGIIVVAILVLTFFVGRWTAPEQVVEKKITIPGKNIKTEVLKPILVTQYKDKLVYKKDTIETENPINEELAQKYLDLEKKYTGVELDKKRVEEYLKLAQKRKYDIPFENERVKISGIAEVTGELNSYEYDIELKPFEFEVETLKPKINLFLGGGVSNNIELDKFNVDVKTGLQFKSGDIVTGSYGLVNKSFNVGYLKKL